MPEKLAIVIITRNRKASLLRTLGHLSNVQGVPPIVVTEHFPQKMDYVPARDFRPVAIAVLQPAVLVVRPTLGVKSVDELIAYAKRNTGKLQFGVQGLGGEMHLTVELFKKTSGFSINPVLYNAAAHAIVDLLGDRLDAMFLVIPPIKGHLDSGKLLPLATLSPTRISALPRFRPWRSLAGRR